MRDTWTCALRVWLKRADIRWSFHAPYRDRIGNWNDLFGGGSSVALSLPAKVSTRVAKRKTRRGPGARDTRVGSICSVLFREAERRPRATRARDARVPATPLLVDVASPWRSFLPISSRRGRPHPSATKGRREESTEKGGDSTTPLPPRRFSRPRSDAADIRLITRIIYIFPALFRWSNSGTVELRAPRISQKQQFSGAFSEYYAPCAVVIRLWFLLLVLEKYRYEPPAILHEAATVRDGRNFIQLKT